MKLRQISLDSPSLGLLIPQFFWELNNSSLQGLGDQSKSNSIGFCVTSQAKNVLMTNSEYPKPDLTSNLPKTVQKTQLTQPVQSNHLDSLVQEVSKSKLNIIHLKLLREALNHHQSPLE